MEKGGLSMGNEKEPRMPELTVVRLTDGLGFGDGDITLRGRSSDEQNPLDAEVIQTVEGAIDSPQILRPIDMDDNNQPVEDDGCGDGRRVKRIFEGSAEKKKSLNRAKVFGGGATMATAAMIGLGAVQERLASTFSSAISRLKERKIPFGGHTSDHASYPDSGCGAIDKAPVILEKAAKYQEHITDAIALLSGDEYDKDGLRTVFTNFSDYSKQVSAQEHAGKDVTDEIIDSGKVVKELEGPHLETHIVINTVPGYTVDQNYIREISDGKAQVFAVDEWRIRQLADALYDESDEQEQAYLSMLVYTLGTAATLTQGDLPVFVVSKQPEVVAA